MINSYLNKNGMTMDTLKLNNVIDHLVILLGQPKPQPRARTFWRKDKTGNPLRGKNGQVLPPTTWSSKEGQESYINQIIKQRPIKPFEGAIKLRIKYWLKRPKSVSIKKRPYPTTKPDLTNLTRFIEDQMSDIYYHDDAMICDHDIQKRYADDGNGPRTEIFIKMLSNE